MIAAEAPIRDDLLVEQIARAPGFKQSYRAIRDRVMTLARASAQVAQKDRGATFVWPDLASVATWDRADTRRRARTCAIWATSLCPS